MKQPHLVLLVDDHSLITTAMSALLKACITRKSKFIQDLRQEMRVS